ncbi:MAG: hypothetical protein JWL77_6400 [Chthonomonadaceae bacterium]|nr:hypothetical protein [Chthonomonadaceae bacterium]
MANLIITCQVLLCWYNSATLTTETIVKMSSGYFELQNRFVGERLCLDFINTACRRREVELEFLGSGEELRQWLRFAEGGSKKQFYVDELWSVAYGERMLSRAIALRMALRDLVLSVIEKKPPPAVALETLNAALRANPTHSQIGNTPEGFKESIVADHLDDTWLVTIAKDAVDLLCHSDLSLLRQCEHPTCVRVFYDTTKNHKRRWCVEKCGSHSKAAAYYRRKVAKVRLAAAEGESTAS